MPYNLCTPPAAHIGPPAAPSAMNPSAVANSIPQIARTVPNLRKKNGAQRIATTCASCDDENTVPIRSTGIRMRAKKTVVKWIEYARAEVPNQDGDQEAQTRSGWADAACARSGRGAALIFKREPAARARAARSRIPPAATPDKKRFRKKPNAGAESSPAAARPPGCRNIPIAIPAAQTKLNPRARLFSVVTRRSPAPVPPATPRMPAPRAAAKAE